jgi:hypothetical protein
MASSTIVQKLWNYCNVLRDDGMSYGGVKRKSVSRMADGLWQERDSIVESMVA